MEFSLSDSLISAVEGAEDSVADFTSLCKDKRLTSLITGPSE